MMLHTQAQDGLLAMKRGNPLATWRTTAMISCTITAGGADSTSQQIPHRGPDLRLGVVRARKLPIVLI